MVQVQSTWFPLVDRNPQTFVDIYNAKESDFQKATQRVYHSPRDAVAPRSAGTSAVKPRRSERSSTACAGPILDAFAVGSVRKRGQAPGPRSPCPATVGPSRAVSQSPFSGPVRNPSVNRSRTDLRGRMPTVTTSVRAWFGRDEGPPTSGVSPIRPVCVFTRHPPPATRGRDERPPTSGVSPIRRGGRSERAVTAINQGSYSPPLPQRSSPRSRPVDRHGIVDGVIHRTTGVVTAKLMHTHSSNRLISFNSPEATDDRPARKKSPGPSRRT